MLSEFEFIDNIKSRFGLDKVGDDCAVLPKDQETDLVITADLLVEDIDFRLDWSTPEQIGHKALAVSLSDIAAMGAVPKWAMLSIAFPQELWKTAFVGKFYQGWHRLADQYEVELVGGDVSKTPVKLVIDSIVGGEVPTGRAFLRSGARPGDHIYVTGTLGGAAGGLKLLSTNGAQEVDLMHKQLEPSPQIILAKQLQQLMLVSASIDISDGLSSDLSHICKASGVGARLFSERVPVEPNLSAYFSPDDALEMALHGGEDFELLFTSGHEITLEGVTRIGEIMAEAGGIEIQKGADVAPLEAKGFQHFSKNS